MTFGGNTPYTAIGQNWTAIRLPGEQPLAVLERPDVGQRPAHRQDRLRVPPPRLPVPGWGQATGGSSTSIAWAPAATTRAATTSAATGDPFASFLLGQVQDASQTIPVYPTFNEAYTAVWINDEFKVNEQLTLTLGMRFDYQSARTESDDQYSTFDPNTPNPGGRRHSRRVDLRGRGRGPVGTRTFENPR